MMHLFGMVAYGPAHVTPYCTCGKIFRAHSIYDNAKSMRADWQRHVKEESEEIR